ncbi:SAM-dependent methyltransferase, partial [Patescibacteria group bacterium]
QCVKEKVEVIAVPGASALLAGLVVSGLPMDKFMFLGFLPKKQGKKEKIFEKMKEISQIMPQTFVFYESPFRIKKTLQLLADTHSGVGMEDVEVVLGRELTKKFEEIQRGTPVQLIKELGDKKIKGEIVVFLHL